MAERKIEQVLQQSKLISDGAFGTYYAQKYDTPDLPERANLEHPERVKEIHEEYIRAGAGIIRSNTYACNTVLLQADLDRVRETVRRGYALACEAAKDRDVFVAADIGPIPCEDIRQKEAIQQEYVEICRTFLEAGADIVVFETFSELEGILPAIEYIGERAFVIVQFAVSQFGYSHSGLSVRRLFEEAGKNPFVNAVGLNCGVGPGHMQQILQGLKEPKNGLRIPAGKFLTALPNAGYPQAVSNRMIFSDKNRDYFTEKISDIAKEGADIVGGCCGTTPEYIRQIHEKVQLSGNNRIIIEGTEPEKPSVSENHAFYAGKEGKKLIAVELAPPLGSDDAKLMEAAHLLEVAGVDVVTFPDSPSGRTRADSVLVAEKVARETGLCVMPHLCCRDKNAIAMRSQLLGAHINRIYNFLVITGDPIPSMVRASVKSVFNFDSVGLMKIMEDMNDEQFANSAVCYGGAINQGRRNLDVEIGRVKKKMNAGATFFLTQPIFSKEGAERIRKIKEETGARILCGIMPFVSLKNAVFMKNEMAGIDVTEEVLSRYREDMTKEEGEQAGVALAKEMISITEDFVDGYYFSFPFNRVYLLESILQNKSE